MALKKFTLTLDLEDQVEKELSMALGSLKRGEFKQLVTYIMSDKFNFYNLNASELNDLFRKYLDSKKYVSGATKFEPENTTKAASSNEKSDTEEQSSFKKKSSLSF